MVFFQRINKSYSILRTEQDKKIKGTNLKGRVLDVGGDKKSDYYNQANQTSDIYTININPTCKPDEIVDIEKKFPFDANSFDHVLCFNVLEHVVETQHVVAEMVRVVKPKGTIVITTPFLYYIHGSPDDYQRYTASYYKRMAQKYNCDVLSIKPLGNGFFSIGFNFIGGVIPTLFLKLVCKKIAVSLDTVLCKVSSRYQKLSNRLPMGYFVVLQKK